MRDQESVREHVDYLLLEDGREAFPEILRCIERAVHSIRINMFIWRDDEIGNRIAASLLAAADRGVEIQISVDRYGMVLEMCEEGKTSFFHRAPTRVERIKRYALERFYPMPGAAECYTERDHPLREALLSHPRVTVEKDAFKADHSKYYIFDEQILILGGINIEDKEAGADRQGRVYQDYMMRVDGATAVGAFLDRMDRGIPSPDGRFIANTKRTPKRAFEAEAHYLKLIEEAEEELTVTMAYFSPLSRFIRALLAAERRGVRVCVLIPSCANFQNDTNRRTVCRLLKKSHGGIRVLLSPKMVHTKLIANERFVSFGSTNITKKAFAQLDELNLCLPNDQSPSIRRLWESIRRNQALCEEVSDARRIKYSRLRAFFEGFLV